MGGTYRQQIEKGHAEPAVDSFKPAPELLAPRLPNELPKLMRQEMEASLRGLDDTLHQRLPH